MRKGRYFTDMLGGVQKGFCIGEAGSGFFVAFALGGLRRPAYASLPSVRPPATRIRSLQCGPFTCVAELPRLLGKKGL